ncbi:ribonuclease P protein subunit p14-like [Actinia tenebrosa]|uniref:Ribonuclease P protein subunit p14-like n=1 Tax=Actinia tenebrosa TaxID=6105 RepID=A0A6P8HYS2_ACTTE|nr:ribonuclease P protein subunit p14-like [Actinia tenebrosa]
MERVTFKQKAEYFYLKVLLEFERCDGVNVPEIDMLLYKRLLIQALEELHGQVGAALTVDVLKYNSSTLQAILRVPESGLVKVWSALTLFGFYQDQRCAFRVLQVSPHLMAFAVDSRQWHPENEMIKT